VSAKTPICLPRQVLCRGAGDLASGVAHRLWQSGFTTVMLELPEPLVVRRTVAFAAAVFAGVAEVEGIRAKHCRKPDEIPAMLEQGIIPVYTGPAAELVAVFRPEVYIDATMTKRNTGTAIDTAEIVIGLGPGFTAGRDVHAVIETQRGHDLGRVIYAGAAAPDTGVPGNVGGFSAERLLRAPVAGRFVPLVEIGDLVEKGREVALVGNTAVKAGIDGLVRGLLYPGLAVGKGMKIGDIDPRGATVNYRAISDKARSVAGGVLEAILHLHCTGTQNQGLRTQK
jgi:xanthine dehydrogenase accessory factor